MNKFLFLIPFGFILGSNLACGEAPKCHRLRFIIGNVTHHGRDWFGVRQLG